MASTLNSDNGVVSGSAGLKSSADATGVLALQTNGTTAVSISAAQVVTLTNALPVASGGTGAATYTANSVLLGNTTSAFQEVAPGASGNVLTSNGTTWASAAAGGGFAAGTAILFYQAAAPTGWTKSTTHDNKAIRVVTGATGGGSGGTTAFTTVFANQTPTITTSGLSVGATTLSTAQLASHAHSITISVGDGYQGTVRIQGNCGGGGTGSVSTDANGSGGSHTHSISGSATSSAVTLNVQYIDVIICTKN